MIVTLTLNPSLDRTIEVEQLVRGSVLRARASRLDPGGKGVNVSRALAAHGLPTMTLLPSGGTEGAQLAGLLVPLGVEVVLVPIGESTRSNVAVVEPDGTTTKLNEPGPRLSGVELAAVTGAAATASHGAAWLVAAGSLPPAVGPGFYADLVRALRATPGNGSLRVAVDSSGAPLTAAIDAGPDLVKPNRDELAEAAGTAVDTLGDVVAAAGLLRRRGARTVLASLGRDGAVLVDADGAVHGEAGLDEPRSTVGAGDAMLAGFLAAGAGGATGPAALAEALAWGSAAAALPGSQMPGPNDLHRTRVVVHDRLDTHRRLED